MPALLQELWSDARSQKLIPSLTSTLLNGILMVIIGISFAAFLFTGDLQRALPQGISMMMFTIMMAGVVIGLLGKIRGAISVSQDAPLAITAAMLGRLVKDMGDNSEAEIVATAFAAIAIAALLTGILFVLLGRFKMGNLMRYIPYPVVGGFLAGTGLLLLQGSLGMMSKLSFSYSDLSPFLEGDALQKWIPGLLLALAILIITRRYSHYLLLPSLLVIAVVAFFIGMLVVGASMDDVEANGWLLGPFPEEGRWEPIFFTQFSSIDWKSIVAEGAHIPIIMLIATMSLLLNVSGIEVATEGDVDINRELQTAGVSNIITGAAGGYVGFPTLSLTVLGYRMGATSRLVAVFWGLLFGGVLIAGTEYVAVFPRVVLGSLVAYIGLSMLVEWVYDGWFKMPRQDYAIVWLIVIVIAAVGFLEGVLVGILVAMLVFVIEYSRSDVVRNVLSGANYHSSVDRPPRHHDTLHQQGERIFIVQLHGFIFFGTAANLSGRIITRMEQTDKEPLHYLLLDFRMVRGLDSTAVISFNKLRQALAKHDVRLVFSTLSAGMHRQFERGGFSLAEEPHFHYFSDFEPALEWCEDRLLREAGATQVMSSTELFNVLGDIFPATLDTQALIKYLERREVDAGEFLAHQGEDADDLFFITSGRLQVQLEAGDGTSTRIRSVQPGTVLGEMAMYTGAARSASIVAEKKSVVYTMHRDALERMAADTPELAASFHDFIARVLARRLKDTTATLQAVL